MTDPKDSHGDEHIEDLLSQLQGIFGRLSNSEEEESKEKLDVPANATPPAAASLTPTPPAPAEPVSPPVMPPVVEVTPKTPTPVPAPSTPASPAVEATVPASSSLPAETSSPADAVPAAAEDPSVLTTVIYYPAGREAEAKILSQKVEVLTPKFTKVAFRIKIASMVAYDPKGEWKDAVVEKASAGGIRAIFLIIERPLEETRRKPLVALLEPKKVYFQDVPILSIEKRAFYTDLLLGLVFFFDTMKSSSENT